MEQYCALEKNETTHPIFLCSCKEYKLLKKNTILLGNPNITNDNKTSRMILYDTISIGENIKCRKEGNEMMINFHNTHKKDQFM